ncbi:MAG: hypothetical protein RR063_03655 [Anaerovoracaceae bacterium]
MATEIFQIEIVEFAKDMPTEIFQIEIVGFARGMPTFTVLGWLAQKPCQGSDKAGGWFGVTAQKLCQPVGMGNLVGCQWCFARAMPTEILPIGWARKSHANRWE